MTRLWLLSIFLLTACAAPAIINTQAKVEIQQPACFGAVVVADVLEVHADKDLSSPPIGWLERGDPVCVTAIHLRAGVLWYAYDMDGETVYSAAKFEGKAFLMPAEAH